MVVRSNRYLAGLGLISALLASARAQGQETRDPAAAEALFRQGRTASEQRDFTKSTVNSECSGKECSPAGLDAAHSGKNLGLVSTIGFVTAGVGLGAATYLFLAAPAPTDALRDPRRGQISTAGAYALGLRREW